jgi:hypothetical protein
MEVSYSQGNRLIVMRDKKNNPFALCSACLKKGYIERMIKRDIESLAEFLEITFDGDVRKHTYDLIDELIKRVE